MGPCVLPLHFIVTQVIARYILILVKDNIIVLNSHIMNDNLSTMLGYFPNYKEEVEVLFVTDHEFMVLVTEYLLCKKEVKLLVASNKEKQALAYSDTINELEQELLAILERQKLIKY